MRRLWAAVAAAGGAGLLWVASSAYRRIARQGEITDRFVSAVDQLGHGETDVRIGGTYALERIARYSLVDRAAVREVLVAFIRNHAPWPPRPPGQYRPNAPIDMLTPLRDWAPDVQACLDVLGRDPGGKLDLHGVDLRGADLAGANLEGANLTGAHLDKADLSEAHLKSALLRDANLEAVDLRGAWLEDAVLVSGCLGWADLSGAHLPGAILSLAHLGRTRLRDADMRRVNLVGADLSFADLGGAHLEGAILRRTVLTTALLDGTWLEGAVTDQHTSWPDGFDWRAAGASASPSG